MANMSWRPVRPSGTFQHKIYISYITCTPNYNVSPYKTVIIYQWVRNLPSQMQNQPIISYPCTSTLRVKLHFAEKKICVFVYSMSAPLLAALNRRSIKSNLLESNLLQTWNLLYQLEGRHLTMGTWMGHYSNDIYCTNLLILDFDAKVKTPCLHLGGGFQT